MLDFELQRFTRRCARTERELQPGETYYSVLVAQGGEVVRVDYSEAAWEGPPQDAIGFWRSKIPPAGGRKPNWAPNDVLLDYFQRLQDDPGKADIRCVMALLLIRRRLLRWEETETVQGQEYLVLHCPRNETDYRVLNVSPSAERARAIQDELVQLLNSDAA